MSFVKTLPGTVVEVVPTDTVANGEAFVPSFTASKRLGTVTVSVAVSQIRGCTLSQIS